MTEASKDALEAVIRQHEASVGNDYSSRTGREGRSSNEARTRREPSAPVVRRPAEKKRRTVKSADSEIEAIHGMLGTGRWPSCRMLESEGIPDLALRVATEKWKQSGNIPTWEEVLDDIERWLGDGEGNRKR